MTSTAAHGLVERGFYAGKSLAPTFTSVLMAINVVNGRHRLHQPMARPLRTECVERSYDRAWMQMCGVRAGEDARSGEAVDEDNARRAYYVLRELLKRGG